MLNVKGIFNLSGIINAIQKINLIPTQTRVGIDKELWLSVRLEVKSVLVDGSRFCLLHNNWCRLTTAIKEQTSAYTLKL